MTIITLNNIQHSSNHLTKVIEPSLETIIDFRRMALESKIYTTNWVFLRFSEENKTALEKLRVTDYPALKSAISKYAAQWKANNWVDSLNKAFAGFEELLVIEKGIMNDLKTFSDYDDPMIKFEAERKIEEEVLPRSASLINSIKAIRTHWIAERTVQNNIVSVYSTKLRMFIIALSVTMILIGVFLSLFMTRLIIQPINKIRHIVTDLGNGISRKVTHDIKNDEISEMIRSVNNLSEKLQATAAFATEIGNRNFESYFEPLGAEDALGKALVAMRDNLKASNENLNEAQHIAKLGSWEWDIVNNGLLWSDELYDVFDTDRNLFNASYEGFLSFVHPDDRENVRSLMSKSVMDHLPFSYECRIISSKNITKIISAHGKPTKNDKGELIRLTGIAQDITEQKKAEAELLKSEKQYRQIVETSQEGIWVIDENNYTVFVNKKMCEMLEYSREEMMGKQNYDFKNDDEKKKAMDQIKRRKGGLHETHESSFVTKSGKTLWTNVSTNPVLDEAGNYKGAMAMFTDITKRKQDELLIRKSQARLIANNMELERKNKELQQFAYVASHDLQEPLITTGNFVGLLQKQYLGRLDNKADQYLSFIMQSSERMRTLITGLLEYSRIGANKELQLVNTQCLLREVLNDLNVVIHTSGAHITVGELPVIRGYDAEIKQLFHNLLANAIKFRKNDVPLQINIAAIEKEDFWEFTISDNGIGLEKKHSERIFVIFQRLNNRSHYPGSGIGLSYCKKIVELHKGNIRVESIPGTGSIFYFTIQKNPTHETQIELHTCN
ncbi:MAG: PAS domain S-box protein [Ferruginibacter sp.]